MDKNMIRKGKILQPLLCSAWQASKDDGDKYRYAGSFAPNTDVLGDWVQMGQVQNPDDWTTLWTVMERAAK